MLGNLGCSRLVVVGQPTIKCTHCRCNSLSLQVSMINEYLGGIQEFSSQNQMVRTVTVLLFGW